MKMLMAGLLLMAGAARGADLVPDAEAGKHVGEEIVVSGTIAQVKHFKGGSEALDLGAKYPKEAMDVYIPASQMEGFPVFKVGEKIEVKGKVTLYQGRPEIKATGPWQIVEE